MHCVFILPNNYCTFLKIYISIWLYFLFSKVFVGSGSREIIRIRRMRIRNTETVDNKIVIPFEKILNVLKGKANLDNFHRLFGL